MRKLTITLCLSFAVLLGSVGVSMSADFRNCEQEYKKKNYNAAARLCLPFAEQGNATAQKNLGFMYHNGDGVSQDYKTAMKWFRLAAKQGHATAQYNLGLMYRNGRGVPQDNKTAVKWWKLAAEQGVAVAQ